MFFCIQIFYCGIINEKGLSNFNNDMSNNKLAQWVLRIVVAGEFIGHGVFALQIKEGWIQYFTALGFSAEMATTVLPLIGIMDIVVAIIILVRPVPIVLLWMVFWGLWTALLRPLAGEPIWDFVERSANWGAPLALLILIGWPKTLKRWLLK